MFYKSTKAALFALPFLLASTTALAHGGHVHKEEAEGVSISGFYDFAATAVRQDIDRNEHDVKFFNDTEVHVKFRQVSDAGFAYGAVIELEADVTAADDDEGLNADKTYLFFESNLGRVEAGAVDDAQARMNVDPSNFARATGGTHGKYNDVIRFPADPHGHTHTGGSPFALGHDDFIHHPSLPLHHQHGATEDANKISYYSPRVKGFQFGGSFIPDTGDSGTAAGFTGKNGHSDYSNAFAGGLHYLAEIGKVGIAASITGEHGEAEVAGHENLDAYAVGTNLTYAGFNLGASYGDWGTSLSHTSPTLKDSRYVSLGAGYTQGAWGTSITYLQSQFHSNKAKVTSLGVDYALAPGLTPYAEVTFADLERKTPASTNNATALIRHC
jgi:hypothetical protein